MHELSIAQSIVAAAEEALAGTAVKRVVSVRLRVGALSGVVEDALHFSWGVAIADTKLEGSTLKIDSLPAMIHCQACAADRLLDTVQSFRCPVCGTLSNDVRQGRELELESLEIEEAD